MPPITARCDVNDVVLSIQAQLLAAGITLFGAPLDPGQILLRADDADPIHTAWDWHLALWVADEKNAAGANDTDPGGGRWDTRSEAACIVTAYSRQSLDPADRDAQRLTDTSQGHYRLRAQVRDALHRFFPLDTNGNQLTVQGLTWLRTGAAKREKGDPSWLGSRIEFSAVYEVSFSPNLNPGM